MNKQKKSKIQEIIDADNNLDKNIQSDINGSYTGKPLNGDEPLQDADDLQFLRLSGFSSFSQNYVQYVFP